MKTAKATSATVVSGTGPPKRSIVCRQRSPRGSLCFSAKLFAHPEVNTRGDQRDQKHRPVDDPGLFGRHHQRRGYRRQNQISRPARVVVLQSGDDNPQREKDEQRFVDEIAREINRARRDRDQAGRRQRSDCPDAFAQEQRQPDRANAEGGRDQTNIEGRQAVIVAKGFPAKNRAIQGMTAEKK